MTATLTISELAQYATGPVGQWAGGGAMLTIALGLALRRRPSRRRPSTTGDTAAVGRRWLIGLAVAAAVGVATLGGIRSFGAVSAKFDSALVPLTADGMIIACTALRLAALTRGWRIPGALVTTYVFIGGTVWLNVDTAHGIADAVAHALAPLAYAVLVEFLAHLLRLHMKLVQPAKPRLSALTWFTSPVITTRVWLHLARTGSDDPVAARALVQQVVRMASRLATLCPTHTLWPFDAARAARAACLQTIRDGLVSARDLAMLLPETGRLTPSELLALVDGAALRCPASTGTKVPAQSRSRSRKPTGTSSPTADQDFTGTVSGTPGRTPTRQASGPRSAAERDSGTANQDRARDYWDRERAAGRVPAGAELARVVGVDGSLGRRWRRDWLKQDDDGTGTSGTVTPLTRLPSMNP